MNRPLPLDAQRQAEVLSQAASQFVPVTVTCRTTEGWSTFKSRFLSIEQAKRGLFIEYPSDPGGLTPEIVIGQTIGVTFRRGHKKCAFSSLVLERRTFTVGADNHVPALAIGWPEEVSELQRRLYYRAPVPDQQVIPVELWRSDNGIERSAYAPSCQGRMLDISAGGMSVLINGSENPGWEQNHRVACSFAASRGETPVVVSARVCHREPTAADGVRIGLHFVGLDCTPEQRDALERVIRLTVRFQRSERKRANRRW